MDLSIVRLYGLDNQAVGCPYKQQSRAKSLIKLGYSSIFRHQFCQSCSLQDSCLYYQGHQQAEDADILIAQHSHAYANPHFYGQVSNGNQERQLVVIDEMPQLTQCVAIRLDAIKQNIQVLKQIESENNYALSCQLTLDILAGMLKAIENKTNYHFEPSALFNFDAEQLKALKFEVADQFKQENRIPQFKNLLWDLELILQRSLPVDYCDLSQPGYQNCLIYRWRPYLANKRVIILSATTENAYLEGQGFGADQVMAEDLEVRYQNLKVVQLIKGNGGKSSVLDSINNQSFNQRHGKLFDLMLRKHPDDKIAIVTTQGEEGQDKQSIINALSPIAERYDKELVAVGQPQIRAGNIAHGKLKIPVFHYGINGVNDLAGKYSVIWFVYAYYFNPTTITEEVYKKHGRHINSAKKDRLHSMSCYHLNLVKTLESIGIQTSWATWS